MAAAVQPACSACPHLLQVLAEGVEQRLLLRHSALRRRHLPLEAHRGCLLLSHLMAEGACSSGQVTEQLERGTSSCTHALQKRPCTVHRSQSRQFESSVSTAAQQHASTAQHPLSPPPSPAS